MDVIPIVVLPTDSISWVLRNNNEYKMLSILERFWFIGDFVVILNAPLTSNLSL